MFYIFVKRIRKKDMKTANTEDNKVSQLKAAYINLQQAYHFGTYNDMISAYNKAWNLDIPNISDKVTEESKNVLYLNGLVPIKSCEIQELNPILLKLNIEGCLNALLNELNQRNVNTYAQSILNHSYHEFFKEEVLYQSPDGNQLKVSDLLSLSKYAIGIAETTAPDNKEFSKAKTVITTLQGIDAILNNKPEDKPINKGLHLTLSFIASTVKSRLKSTQDKRNLALSEIIADLAIDFFCKI